MQLKEDQWYQLPSGRWVLAICVDDPEGPILQGYGIDIAGSDAYKRVFDLYVDPDGTSRCHRHPNLGTMNTSGFARSYAG